MMKYTEGAKCPKCGGEHIEDRFVPADARRNEEGVEFVRRKCRNCNFWWKEEPLYKGCAEDALAEMVGALAKELCTG